MAILKDLIVQGSSRHIGTSYFGYMYGFLTGYVDGNISGNAETASRWQTPRTFTIGDQSIDVDGTGDVTFTISTMGLQPAITLVGSQNDNGYMVSLGNNQDVIIPKPTTTSTYGVIKTYQNAKNTATQLSLGKTNTVGKYYGVVTTTDGFAYVNVPWTDTDIHVTDIQYSDDQDGIMTTISQNDRHFNCTDTIPSMTDTTFGVAKTAFRDPDLALTDLQNASETRDRWYGVQKLHKTGNLIVNVPWKDTVISNVSGTGASPKVGYEMTFTSGSSSKTISVTPASNTSYGVFKSAAAPSKDKASLGVQTTALSGRYYGVVMTKDGFAYVNVNHPWKADAPYAASLYDCEASGHYSVAEGNTTTANGVASHAEGIWSESWGDYSHAEGLYTTTTNTGEHAEGNYNVSHIGSTLHSIGIGTSNDDRKNAVEVTNNGNMYLYGIGEYNGTSLNDAQSLQEYLDEFNETTAAALCDLSDRIDNINPDMPWVYGSGNGTNNAAQMKHGGSSATGQYSVAEGMETTASGVASHGEGWQNTALGIGAHVEGYRSLAQGAFSHAEGTLTTAMAYAHSEGRSTTGGGYASHAEGSHSYAHGAYSHAEGQRSTAYGYISHAGGFNTLAYGDFSITFGSNTLAYDFALAIGKQTLAYRYAIASGFQTTAYDYSVAEGYQSMAFSYFSHAEGAQTFALGSYSHTEGKYTKASGLYSHAEGSNTTASGTESHAEGGNTTASAAGSHAEGGNTTASAVNSHAEGSATVASGFASHASGVLTLAYGSGSKVDGYYTMSYGRGSHAEGAGMITAPPVVAMSGSNLDYTVSAANAAKLRIGYFLNYGITYARVTGISGTTISLDSTLGTLSNASVNVLLGTSVGQYSHAEGLYATASGNYSHAEGSRTTTYGNASHAEGYNSYTVGAISHAEGEFTQTTNRAEHAEGRYNKSNKASNDLGDAGNTMHSVGIGTSTSNRKNAFEIMQNGNTYLIGVGNYDGTNINGSTTYTLQKCVDLWEPGCHNHYSIQQKYTGARATGNGCVAENSAGCHGNYSHAEGASGVTWNGMYAHAEGVETLSDDYGSHSEGIITIAKGYGAHSEGGGTYVASTYGHAEGHGKYVLTTLDTAYVSFKFSSYDVTSVSFDSINNTYEVTVTAIFNHASDNYTGFIKKTSNFDLEVGDCVKVDSNWNWILDNENYHWGFSKIKSITSFNSTYDKIITYNNVWEHMLHQTFTGTQSNCTTIRNSVLNGTFKNFTMHPSPYAYLPIVTYTGAIYGAYSHSEGNCTKAFGDFSHSEGSYTKAFNEAEHAQGAYNLSHWTNETFGSENQTLFSIGCGTSSTDRKNAIEVMQNGDVYVKGVGNYDGTSITNVNTLQAVVNAGGGGGGNAGNSKVFYGTCDTAAATVTKVVDCDDFTSADLVEGVMVIVKFSATNSGAVANLKLNINGIGEKNIKKVYNGAIGNLTAAADLYAGSVIPFIYSGTYWIVAGIDYSTANTIGYNLRTNSSTLPMKNYTGRYRLLFTSADGKNWVASTTSTSTNASAARTPTTEKIDPFGEIVYYGSTTAVSAGSNPGAAVLWQQYVLSLGYSFTASTLLYPKPVYIKCTPQSDGSAIIDATHPYVQDLPTTEDGYIYIFLGIAYSASAVELKMNHPVYYYSNGKIRIWTGAETIESIPSSGYGQVKSIEVCQTPGDNPNTLYIVL